MNQLSTIAIPLLREGDRLTRAEFEQRYQAIPDFKKAELLHGVVYMASPVRLRQHGRPHGIIAAWMTLFEDSRPQYEFAIDTSIRLTDEDEPQPDSFLYLTPDHGGRLRIDADGYAIGAPEFVVEVDASTADIDIGIKREVYEQAGVLEYLVWRVEDATINWWVLRGNRFELLLPDESGVIRSVNLPGLWLNVPALLRRDRAAVLQTLREGLASTEGTSSPS